MRSTFSSFTVDTPRIISTWLKLKVFFSNPIGFMGMMFFLIGSVVSVVFLSSADFKSAFVFSDKDPSTACVLDNIEATGNKINKHTVYDYSYHYSVNGKAYKGHSFSTSQQHQAGDTLSVYYKADKPEISHIEGMRAAPFELWFLLFTLIFPIIGIVFLIISIRKFFKTIHLITYGVLTSGKVLRKEPTMTKINKQRVYNVYFEFKLPNNTFQEASVNTHITHNLGDEAEEPLVYDSQDPSSAVLLDTLPKQVRLILTQGTY